MDPRSKPTFHLALSVRPKRKDPIGSFTERNSQEMYHFVQKTKSCEYCERELPVFNEFIMLETFAGYLGQLPPLLYVKYGPDPFGEEIHGDSTPHWLCQDCVYASAMEI